MKNEIVHVFVHLLIEDSTTRTPGPILHGVRQVFAHPCCRSRIEHKLGKEGSSWKLYLPDLTMQSADDAVKDSLSGFHEQANYGFGFPKSKINAV